MRTFVCGICLLLAGPAYAGAETQMPMRPLEVGDTWTYRQTAEFPDKATEVHRPVFSLIVENKDKTLVLGITSAELRSRSAQPVWNPVGAIAPDVCIYDFINRDAIGLKQTCGIRLESGKTWASDVSDTVARKQLQSTAYSEEDVVVPAGKFSAQKIQRNETVTEVAYPGIPESADGYVKVYRITYWYSPEAKGFVKVVRENRTGSGKLLLRLTEELEAFEKRTTPALGKNQVILGRPVVGAR